MKAVVRPYEARDFPAALTLVQHSAGGAGTIERLMPLLAADGTVAIVAEDGGSLVGIAVGVAAGGTGWVGGVVATDDGRSTSGSRCRPRSSSSTRSRTSRRSAATSGASARA